MTAPSRTVVSHGVPGVLAKVMRYELSDVVRSRWLLSYTLFFLLLTDVILRFSGSTANALASLVTVVQIIIPLVNIVFGTIYLYNAREFTELLLAQPVDRRQLFGGIYLGLTLPLSVGFAFGIAVPFALHGVDDATQRITVGLLIGVGVALSFAFTGIAFLLALRIEDKAKALGAAIGIWLLTTVLYDGIVVILMAMFADNPLERPLIALMLLNPVDLARVLLVLRLDVSALMGYTGAVFKSFFGHAGGIALATFVLITWAAGPPLAAMRTFRRKDF